MTDPTRGMSEQARADAIMNDVSMFTDDGSGDGDVGGTPKHTEVTSADAGGEAGKPAGEGGISPAPKKYQYKTPDGKVFEAKVNDDGTIQLPDIEAILKDPHEYYRRHFHTVEERNLAAARKKIREEELGGIGELIQGLRQEMSESKTQRQTPPAERTTDPDAVDWSAIDANDPLQVAQALQRQNKLENRNALKELFEEYFAPITEASHAEAHDAMTAAYDVWKDYDLKEFKSLLKQNGVSFTKDGIAFSRQMTPQMVTKIAHRLVEHLNTVQTQRTRIQSAVDKAVAMMPSDDEGSLWDGEYHTRQLKAYIADQIEAERPVETDQDCFLIAMEGTKKIMNEDVQRIAKQSARIAKVIAKAKGGVQKIETKQTETPPEKKDSDLTGEERDKRRIERMQRDGVINR